MVFCFRLQITDLKLSVDVLEKERDFYFAKLRDIEILCQDPELENLPVREFQQVCYTVVYKFAKHFEHISIHEVNDFELKIWCCRRFI